MIAPVELAAAVLMCAGAIPYLLATNDAKVHRNLVAQQRPHALSSVASTCKTASGTASCSMQVFLPSLTARTCHPLRNGCKYEALCQSSCQSGDHVLPVVFQQQRSLEIKLSVPQWKSSRLTAFAPFPFPRGPSAWQSHTSWSRCGTSMATATSMHSKLTSSRSGYLFQQCCAQLS